MSTVGITVSLRSSCTPLYKGNSSCQEQSPKVCCIFVNVRESAYMQALYYVFAMSKWQDHRLQRYTYNIYLRYNPGNKTAIFAEISAFHATLQACRRGTLCLRSTEPSRVYRNFVGNVIHWCVQVAVLAVGWTHAWRALHRHAWRALHRLTVVELMRRQSGLLRRKHALG